ncbi:hypothetical protein ACI782_06940 [Geodermatophilus sp. SYSU D00703]
MAEPVGVQVGRVCPGCGREDSVPLRWGLPAVEDMRLAERGLVALGGCMLPEDEPALSCRACGLEWGRKGDPTTDEQALADLLGVQYADVVRALGTGWRRESAAEDPVQWFVSGEPAQVAVGVEGPSLVLARPLTSWGERTELQPADRREFSRDDLLWTPEVVAEAAEAIAARRRRSFRWCRSCRRPHAPEWFVGAAGTCRQCVSLLDGVDAEHRWTSKP